MSRRALGIASAVYLVGVAAFAAYAAWLAATEHFRDLYADEWVVLAQRDGRSFARWLVTSHNGHLIPVTRFLLHADLEWLSGRGALPVGVGLLATAAAAALLWLPVRASGIEPASVRRAVGAFLASCLIYAGLCYGLLWGFAAHAPLMTAWLALAVAALIGYATPDPPWRRSWLLALAFTGAFGASVACATGVGAWAALLAVAVAARLPVRVLGAIAVGGAACTLLVAAAPSPELDSQALDLPVSPWAMHPVVVLKFLLHYLGTPLAWPAHSWLGVSEDALDDVAFSAGAIGLVACFAHVARRIRAGRLTDTAGLLGLALMTFGVAAAALTSIGRAGAFKPVSLRFTPFALLFWMGAAVALAAPGTARSARWRSRIQPALVLLLPLASLVLVHSLGPHLDHHRERRARIERHTLMLLVGIRSNGLFRVLANSRWADSVRSAVPSLEQRGRGPFADPRWKLLSGPLVAAGIGDGVRACAGEIGGLRASGGRRGDRGAIEGVLRAEDGRELPVSILVADARGTIQGLGNVLPPEDAQAEWYAYRARGSKGKARVFGVFADGSACAFDQRRR